MKNAEDIGEEEFRNQGEAMLDTGGATMNFVIERTDESIKRSHPDSFLSEDAMHYLERTMAQWVMSRFVRRGRGAVKTVEVELRVKFDGEEMHGAVAYFTANGQHRQDGAT